MEFFLKNVKQNLSTIDQKKSIHIVIGNESSDLDSCISSIAYAYLLYISEYKSNDDSIVLPVINTTRKLLKLKTEVLYWLNTVLNVNGDSLICKDDLDFLTLKDEDRQVFITLTDHNFNEEFEKVGNLVEIIDHHQNSLNRTSINIKTEIDKTIGSCCTLIANRFINYYEKNELKFDEQIAFLLYGPIILDTINFQSEARRFNEIDVQTVEKLESFIANTNYSISRNDVHNQLTDARNSIAGLKFKEMLFKDMKNLTPFENFNVMIPSISGELICDLICEDKINKCLNDLKKISNDKNYSLIVLMAIKQEPLNSSIKRDLAIFSLNENLLKRVSQALINYNNKELNLNVVDCKSNFILFTQNAIEKSRKIVIPALEQLFSSKQFIEDYKSGNFNTKPLEKLQVNNQEIKTGTTPIQQQQRSNDNEINGGKLNGQSTSRSSSIESAKLIDINGKSQDSGNYYESYFMDSYVGDFNAEDHVTNDDKLIDQLNWDYNNEQKIENALEFNFDSFGPESILFQTNNDNSLTNQIKKLETIKESSENKDELKNNYQLNSNEEVYDDLISLSITEPQLKQKLENCFDSEKIRNGYSGTAEPKSILQLPFLSTNQETEQISKDLDRQFSNKIMNDEQNQSKNSKEEFLDNLNDDYDDENFNSFIENVNSKSFDTTSTSKDNTLNKTDLEHDVSDVTLKKEDSFLKDNMDSNSLNNDYAKLSTKNENNDLSNLLDNTNNELTDNNLSIETDDKTLISDSFKRQTTLTKSQRRRISPKISKFEETISSSDDNNLIPNNDDLLKELKLEDKQDINQFKVISLDENNLPNLISPEQLNNQPEGGYARTGTLKKKIIADYQDSLDDSTHLNNHQNDKIPESAAIAKTINAPQMTPANNLQDELNRFNQDIATDINNDQFTCPKFIGKGEIRKIDMKVIEPYTRVLSHAGYYTTTANNSNLGESNPPAIILFSSCYLPDRKRKDYDYVIDNLFMYVLSTLHQLIANEYIMIYFNAGTSSTNNLSFNFLRRCYYMIDRKLRKNLKALYLVHPTIWLKTIVIMSKPFINTKFSKKLRFVNNLSELNQLVEIDKRIIPEQVKKFDELIERKKRRN